MPDPLPVPGDVVRIRSARWRVARQTAYPDVVVIDVRGCDANNAGESARFLLPFEPFEPLRLSHVPDVVPPGRWRPAARRAVASASPAVWALDAAVSADLDVLPFQLEPALAVTRGLGARVLIADEVGLGKTVQAGLVLAEVLRRCRGDAHAIVVCPAGLREQWESELRGRFRLDAAIVDSATIAAAAGAGGANPWAARPVAIASIDYVKRPEVMRALEAMVWDAAVLDEAHGLSGRSDRRTAAGALADRARTVVMLTATPHSGDDDAFARVTAAGSLDDTLPLIAFRRTRADVGLGVPRRTRWVRVRQSPVEAQLHRELEEYARQVWRAELEVSPGARLAMTVLMRRACSSAVSLARSIERRLDLLTDGAPAEAQLALPLSLNGEDDEEPGAVLGCPGLSDRARERAVLEQLLRLAGTAAEAEGKLRVLTRFLARARQPAIVFTEYRDTLTHLEARLAFLGPAVLHGGLTPAERREALSRFTAGRVALLLATDAASEGLNLHYHCRLVVNLELPWTPLRLEQRIGRVERIGQRRRVHAIHLIGAGTAEDTTVANLFDRMARADRALSAMRRGDADGRGILQSIVEGADGPAAAAPSTARTLPGLWTPDLRDLAASEAQRIIQWRRLTSPDRGGRERPVVTVLRRGARPVRGFWAFRTEYVDPTRRHVSEALRGIEATGLRLPLRTAEDVRRWCGEAWEALAVLLQRQAEADVASLGEQMHRQIETAIVRERAIVAALGDRRARMSDALVQPGLFDRRSERAAAAQAAVLREALARCEARLADLHAAKRLAVARHELVFALVLG